MRTCCVEGCERPVRARERCASCYKRAWRHGEFEASQYRSRGGWFPLEPLRPHLEGATKRFGCHNAAKLIGIDPTHLYHLRHDYRYVQMNTADRICIALGLPFESLYPLEAQ